MESSTTDQLSSLIPLVSSLLDPSRADSERVLWLNSALKGRKNLIIYLSTKIIMDPDKLRNEHKLSLLLLALIVRLAERVTDDTCRVSVLTILKSIEGFWPLILKQIASPDSTSIGCNSLSLCVNAYRLNRASDVWPARLFSSDTFSSVLSLIQQADTSRSSRTLLVSFEYLLLASRANREAVKTRLSTAVKASTITALLEVGGQVILGGHRRNEILGFDPITSDMELSEVQTFVNDLLEIGGERIYTPLALLCIDA